MNLNLRVLCASLAAFALCPAVQAQASKDSIYFATATTQTETDE